MSKDRLIAEDLYDIVYGHMSGDWTHRHPTRAHKQFHQDPPHHGGTAFLWRARTALRLADCTLNFWQQNYRCRLTNGNKNTDANWVFDGRVKSTTLNPANSPCSYRHTPRVLSTEISIGAQRASWTSMIVPFQDLRSKCLDSNSRPSVRWRRRCALQAPTPWGPSSV